MPGVVWVGIRPGAALAASSVAALPDVSLVALPVAPGQECAVRDALLRDPRVIFAELDYRVRVLVAPDDPAWAQQWGPERIGAPRVWPQASGDPLVVAVLDSGINPTHEDLAANLWRNSTEIPTNNLDDDGNGKVDDLLGWRFVHEWAWDGTRYTYLPQEDAYIADDYGHGTHVAGIIGAAVNNHVGIAGVAANVRLMTVKVLDRYGNGWYSDIAQGILYAVNNGARVINISAGGEAASSVLQAAVTYAYTHGALVIAASGNAAGPVYYPAACAAALAVGAADAQDQRAAFSNYGAALDLTAPGVDIYSTWHSGNAAYITKSGSSMAAPHVSGAAALVWSAFPQLTAVQVSAALTMTAQRPDGTGWDAGVGWGRVDVARAWGTLAKRRGFLPLVLR